MEQVLQLLDQYGLGVALLAVIGLFAWRHYVKVYIPRSEKSFLEGLEDRRVQRELNRTLNESLPEVVGQVKGLHARHDRHDADFMELKVKRN